MPSEPIEAEFARPQVLSLAQEEAFRTLDQEGPLSRQSSRGTIIGQPSRNDLRKLKAEHERAGYHIVRFEKGAGEDPREWGNAKKWFITATTAFLCLAVTLGSSIITGDITGPTRDLGIKQIITNLTVTCFVIGFGIGPLFFAPLSEVLGRRPMYIVSILLYFLFTFPGALAKNAATLVIARQIAGIAASAPMCNVGGTIADIWAIEDRGAPMAVFSATIFVGPCLGPMVGGWIGERAGWRWIYWVLFIFVGCCFALTVLTPETLAPVILKKKAAKLRKETGDDTYRTIEELERPPLTETLKLAIFNVLRFPIAFAEVRGFGLGMTGLTFSSIMVFGRTLNRSIPRTYLQACYRGRNFPRARLYPMMLGAFVYPVALFIFAFTGGRAWIHWIVPCISGALFGFGMILLYISANSYIIDSYSDYAATAMAAKTFLRSEVGAMVPLFVDPMFKNMGFQYAGLLLALVGCAIGPMPFIFYKYGGRIRAASKRASKNQRGMESERLEREKIAVLSSSTIGPLGQGQTQH
ncbi:MFS polyamine transporter [Cyathus striatus]|nr:MFS polyamine transporter [Cyathus striatus]